MSGLEFKACRPRDLEAVTGLFRLAFPKAHHLTPAYLHWSYFENPTGEAVSANLWDGDRLVGHLASNPQKVRLHGREVEVVLLVNVATHPDYRGQGLFLKLVQRVVDLARERGYAAVTGVANDQTWRAYEQKLNFQNVAGLDAHVELAPHRLDVAAATRTAQLMRVWDDAALAWRLNSPANPLTVTAARADGLVVEGASTLPGVRARATIPREGLTIGGAGGLPGPAVVLGLAPQGTQHRRLAMTVPNRLRPSPLRLIYQNLADPSDRLDPRAVLFSFLDFDAF